VSIVEPRGWPLGGRRVVEDSGGGFLRGIERALEEIEGD